MFLSCSGEREKGDREGRKFRCYRMYVESVKEGSHILWVRLEVRNARFKRRWTV